MEGNLVKRILSVILLVLVCWSLADQPEPAMSATTLNQFRCPAMFYLTFENGRLTRIESGDYGY